MKISEVIDGSKSRIGHVMEDTAENSSVNPSDTVKNTLSLIATRHNSAMAVVEDGKLLGIITEKDIIVAIEKFGVSALDLEVSSIMTPEPVFADRKDACRDVLVQMINGKFRNMPVYDEGTFSGIIQILEVAEGKLSEVIDENYKLRELVRRFIPKELCCNVEEDIKLAYEKMSEHNLPCVPVVSSNNVAGVITDRDFLTLLGSADFLKQKFKTKS
tara:strand:- start:6 stop:653 length:648 start_codon:yes stop_codon:yes gene_type:complete